MADMVETTIPSPLFRPTQAYAALLSEMRRRRGVRPAMDAEYPPERWIPANLKIQTKDGRLATFTPNSIQRKLDTALANAQKAGKPVRIIGLKARQMGFSTWVQTRLFERCSRHENTHGLVIAHDLDGSDRLFRMSQLFHECLPPDEQPQTDYSSRKEIVFSAPLRSSIHVQVAHQYAGSAHTIQFLHISELAKWSHPATTMLSVMQTVPATPESVVIIESTANGQEGPGRYFYEMWQDAQEGESDYTPLFFPWFEADEYRMPLAGPLIDLSDEEVALKAAHDLDDAQIAWRRWAIRNLCNNNVSDFRQEYPSDEGEAFLRVAGTSVFDVDICRVNLLDSKPAQAVGRLRWSVQPMLAPNGYCTNRDALKVVFVPDVNGPLRVWEMPPPSSENPAYRFMGAADVAEGVEGGDFSSVAVLDRKARRVVAAWHERCDATVWGEYLAMLALWYRAQIAPEVNSAGIATLARIMALAPRWVWVSRSYTPGEPMPDHDEGRFGWRTTQANHGAMVDALIDVIRESRWYDPDEDFWRQAIGVVRSATGKALITGKDRVSCRCVLAAIDAMAPAVDITKLRGRPRKDTDEWDFGERKEDKHRTPLQRSFPSRGESLRSTFGGSRRQKR